MLQSRGVDITGKSEEIRKPSFVERELVFSAHGNNPGKDKEGLDGPCISAKTCGHAEVDYYLIELLSGHKYFQSYLHTICQSVPG